MTEPKDLLLEGLKLAYREDGLNKVTQAAHAMSACVPRLSEAELKQISERVAASIVEHNLQSVPDQERSRWRSRLADISYQLALGVAGSGLYALLAYIANLASASFAGADGPGNADDPARQAARARLLAAIPEADRKSAEELLSFPMLPSLVGVQLERELQQDRGFRDLSALIADQQAARLAASRSWWSRATSVMSAKPTTSGANATHEEEVAQRLLLQAITKQVFFGVTRKASEKLEPR
jgi:hypothetical protein